MSTIISRPRKFKGPKSSYLKVSLNGKVHNVILDAEALADWDTIDTVTIDMVDYDRRMPAADGSEDEKVAADGFVHESWSRPEIVDYTTINDINRQTKIEEAKAERDFVKVKIESKYKLTDDQFAKLQAAL